MAKKKKLKPSKPSGQKPKKFIVKYKLVEANPSGVNNAPDGMKYVHCKYTGADGKKYNGVVLLPVDEVKKLKK